VVGGKAKKEKAMVQTWSSPVLKEGSVHRPAHNSGGEGGRTIHPAPILKREKRPPRANHQASHLKTQGGGRSVPFTLLRRRKERESFLYPIWKRKQARVRDIEPFL